jgi:hypothetical protein
VYGYAASFPYFEVWAPAQADLTMVATATTAVGGVAALLFLETTTFLVVSGCMLSGACVILLFASKVLSADLNLVTAVNTFVTAPVLVTALLHLGFRVSTTVAFNESAEASIRDFRACVTVSAFFASIALVESAP